MHKNDRGNRRGGRIGFGIGSSFCLMEKEEKDKWYKLQEGIRKA